MKGEDFGVRHDFDIRDYGARPDPDFLNTGAIQDAIDACHKAGGGRVACGPGTWVMGCIELRSHVETRGVIRYTPRKYERMVHFRKIGSEV